MNFDSTLGKAIEAFPYVVILIMWVYSERNRADYLLKELIASKNSHIDDLKKNSVEIKENE